MKPQPTNVIGQPLVLGDKKPLEIFFSQYPEFRYWPRKSSVSEFHRLCRQYGWEKDGPEKEVARYEFNIAMKKEFDSLYGSDEKDISNWHKLCYILSIDPVPETLRECRAVSSKLCIPIDSLLRVSSFPLGCPCKACQSCRPRRRIQREHSYLRIGGRAQPVYSIDGEILPEGRCGGWRSIECSPSPYIGSAGR